MDWLTPDWPAPARVRAAITTRGGGVSRGPYASLNLADHVGDDPAAVARNRALLRQCLGLPGEPCWLRQVHGRQVARAGECAAGCEADAVCAQGRSAWCSPPTACRC